MNRAADHLTGCQKIPAVKCLLHRCQETVQAPINPGLTFSAVLLRQTAA